MLSARQSTDYLFIANRHLLLQTIKVCFISSQVSSIGESLCHQKKIDQGCICLPLTWNNWKFWLENQMVCDILFGTFCKLWLANYGWGDKLFAFFSVFPLNLGKF